MGKSNLRFGTLVCVNVAAWCVLGFYGALSAQAPRRTTGAKPPFRNSVEQRGEMVVELREIKELIREQNKLLKKIAENSDGGAKP